MAVRISRPNIMKGAENTLIAYLEKWGDKICHIAASQRNTHPDTWNQQDAYGWGVYKNGKLIRIGFARKTPMAKEKKEFNGQFYEGRTEIKKFLKEYHPELAGYTLVIANAMFYSVFHEEGHTPSGNIYRIISQTFGVIGSAMGDIIRGMKFEDWQVKHMTTWEWTRRPQDASYY